MAEPRRLFFALWPPPRVAEAIVAQAQACGVDGRRIPPERVHLTLAFLGDVSEAPAAGLQVSAARIAQPAFEIALNRVGHFRRPGVAWIGPAAPPDALLDLAAAVQDTVAQAGLELEKRRFRPHVTVARKAAAPRRIRPPEPVVWPVTHFSLTESASVDGRPVYRDLERWSLTPASME